MRSLRGSLLKKAELPCAAPVAQPDAGTAGRQVRVREPRSEAAGEAMGRGCSPSYLSG
jgi:hypothetical protein